VDTRRSDLLKTYPDFSSFKSGFTLSDDFMTRFYNYAAENGLPKNDPDLLVSGNQIQVLLKAYIARDLWSNDEFFEIANENDPKVETAMNILRNWDKYEVMLLNSK
jgi:carboxyl-terminal processing protease